MISKNISSSESDSDSSVLDAWIDDEMLEDVSICVDSDSDSSSSGGITDEDTLLPFDPAAIQEIILQLCDRYRLYVAYTCRQRADGVTVPSAGLTEQTHKHNEGTAPAPAAGAALGEAMGSASIAYVSLRDAWEELHDRLSDLFELAYEHIVGLGFEDYQSAASSLLRDRIGSHLAEILAEAASALLEQKVVVLS